MKIYSSDRYPPWLMRLLEEQYSPDDIMIQIYRGERIPNASDQWSFARSFRRTYMQDMNKLSRQEWVYESDDDEGEDIGKFDEEEAEINIEGGTGEGAAAAGGAAAGGAAGGTPAAGGDKKGDDNKGGDK